MMVVLMLTMFKLFMCYHVDLMQTKLGTYLENRINSFLQDNHSGAGNVTIRVHSSSEKVVEVKPLMKVCEGMMGVGVNMLGGMLWWIVEDVVM